MKIFLFFLNALTFYFIPESIFAQSPNWLWAKSPGGSNGEIGQCIISDASGHVYVAGEFYDSYIIFGNDTLTNTGTGGIFIVKYDSIGNVLWAAGANGNGNVLSHGGQTYGIAIDASGNLIVAGEFDSNTFTFGSTVFSNHSTNGTSDIFIAKYDTSGNLLSATSNGGNDNDRVEGITSDGNGNVYFTGSFESQSITFGTTTLTNSNVGYFDLFIVKFDNSGNVVWAKKAGGTEHDDGYSISVDTSGDVYVTGWFRSPTIVFGSTILTNPTGWNYGFVVKYNSSGNVLWAKRAGHAGMCITADAGNIYVTGEFSGTFTFDTITLSAPLGIEEMFVVKYDLSGNVLWARSSFGTTNGDDSGFSIVTDVNGNVFVAGIFSSDSIMFGNATLTNYNTIGAYDIFVAGYDHSGNNLWARSAGGDAWDISYGMACDVNGNVYITGFFQSSTLIFDSTILTNAGGFDMFIAKLGNTILTSSESLNHYSDKLLIYPNPLSQTTSIYFSLSKSQKVSIRVFDVQGNLVSILSENVFEAGENKVTWSAQDLITGIYFLQFQSAENFQVKKLIVAK